MVTELKVVVTMKGSKGTVGVSQPDCDPLFETFSEDGEFETEELRSEALLGRMLERIPAMVREAEAKWAENPRYPKGEAPPPPAPKTVQQPAGTRGKAAASRSRESEKPLMF